MERNQAITMLSGNVDLSALANAVAVNAEAQPNNWTLQMCAPLFASMGTDTTKSWFTGFGALVINQRTFAGDLIDQARIASGQTALTAARRKKVLDAVGDGAKITKADAGRALDATT